MLVVYDRGGIDFAYWKRCRQECAVYFLSRVKAGMVFEHLMDRPAQPGDPRDRGVEHDRLVHTRDGVPMRVVGYREPETGKFYEFLTNEPDLPAGILAELYRRRWEIEKVFDEIKNKLGEKKAWATSLAAKRAQGQLVATTHNLMVLYQRRLEKEHGVRDEAEERRRQQRAGELERIASGAGRAVSRLLLRARRAIQPSVKFVRWLRHALREDLAEAAATPRLRLLLAHL